MSFGDDDEWDVLDTAFSLLYNLTFLLILLRVRFPFTTTFGDEDLVQRAPLSGGGAIKSSGGSDLKNTPHIYVEAKRTEKFQIHQSVAQVKENIEISQSDAMPIVITRRNRQETGDSLCVLKLDDFLELYKLLIKEKGMSD